MEECKFCGNNKFIIRGDISGARFTGSLKKNAEGSLSFIPEEIIDYDVGKFKKPICSECKKEFDG